MVNSKVLGKNLSCIISLLSELREGGINKETLLSRRREIFQYMENKFKEGKCVYLVYMKICSESGSLLHTSLEEIVKEKGGIVILSETYSPSPRPAYRSGNWGTPWLVSQCEAGYVLTTQKYPLEITSYRSVITYRKFTTNGEILW